MLINEITQLWGDGSILFIRTILTSAPMAVIEVQLQFYGLWQLDPIVSSSIDTG